MRNDFMQITEASLSQAVKHIEEMPIAAAEKAIDDIAHRKGDEFVRKMLDNLSPVKIAAILRQHDFSCPSIISWILSPEVIANVVKTDPLFWKDIHDAEKTGNFFQIQNDALDLITSLLENANSRDRQGDILEHISRDSLSLLYLCLPFIGWQVKKEQTLFFEDPDIDIGTADYLYEIIRWAAPQVSDLIYNSIHSNQTSLPHYITDLWSEAFDHFDTAYDYNNIETVMFVPAEYIVGALDDSRFN